MPIIFKARTSAAYSIKIAIDLLKNNLHTACLRIDKDGIFLSMNTTKHVKILDMRLDAINFIVYKFRPDELMFMGINLGHLHQVLRSIKKKDSIQMFIDSDAPSELGIKVIPRENNRITTSVVKIQDTQWVDLDIPTGYKIPVNIPSGDFHKMIKDMTQIGNKITVIAHQFHILFRCDAGSIIKRDVAFGSANESDDDSDDDETDPYERTFETDQFRSITKLSNLGNIIQIFPCENEPLLFRSKVGDLGVIDIYIWSAQDLDRERLELAECDSDDE